MASSITSKLAHVVAILAVTAGAASAATYYVANAGNDSWSGRLADPDPTGTDGPFRTVSRGQKAVCRHGPRYGKPITVILREGTHFLDRPLELTSEDSGTEECPVRYRALEGETPVLSAGRRVTDWRRADADRWVAHVSDAAREWRFDQLFVNGERQVRARHPNLNHRDPASGHFLFASLPSGWEGDYGGSMSMALVGYWTEYDFSVPADGEYRVWFRYGAHNKRWGATDMAGRCSLLLDGGERIWLESLPDTGDWRRFVWSAKPNAVLKLSAGAHVLRWTNEKGPGLNIDAIALCNDPDWRPSGMKPPRPRDGHHLVEIQAEAFNRKHGDQLRVDRARSHDTVHFDSGALGRCASSPRKLLTIWVYQANGLCSNQIVPIAEIDARENWLKTSVPVIGPGVYVGARFFVENAREALDEPGEWYFDREGCTVHYWPRDGKAPTDAVASALDRILVLRGRAEGGELVEHVRFEGITFAHTGYELQKDSWYHGECNAVWLRDARHCRFVGCTFRNLGGAAVVMNGHCTNNDIVGCEVSSAGAGGFTINSHPENLYALDRSGKRYTQPANCHHNRIVGNHIHHIGQIWKHGAGVYLHVTSHNEIRNNDIHHTSRHPIIVTGNCDANAIEYNRILHTNLETADTGAIHTYMIQKSDPPNRICGNVIGDVIGMGTTPDGEIRRPYYTWGIYLDGYTSHTIVRDNVVYRTVRGGIMINGGDNNVIENNTLVDHSDTQMFFNLWKGRGKGNRFVRNVVAWSGPEAKLRGGSGKGIEYAECDHNLYWHAGQPVPELAALRKQGLEQHSVLADPLFVDPAADDFRLRPESPAFQLRIKPINTSAAGRRGWRAERPH